MHKSNRQPPSLTNDGAKIRRLKICLPSHSSLRNEISELLDVIIVDLDGGSLRLPECVVVSPMPEYVVCRAVKALTLVQLIIPVVIMSCLIAYS